MSKNNSKSLTSLRQKLRKYNKDFEEEMAKFRENPDIGDDDEDQIRGTHLNYFCKLCIHWIKYILLVCLCLLAKKYVK